jgi:hypothetical protein
MNSYNNSDLIIILAKWMKDLHSNNLMQIKKEKNPPVDGGKKSKDFIH